MTDSDARQRADPPVQAGRSAYDLNATKLLHPPVRAGTVRRVLLIERLAGGT